MSARTKRQREEGSVSLATLEKLLEVSQSLLLVHDLEPLLQQIAESAGTVLKADVIALYEYHEEEDDVTLPPVRWRKIQRPEIPVGEDQTRPHRESIVFRMLERTEPFYAATAGEDWALLIEGWQEQDSFVHREGIVSSAAIPLIAEEKRVGVLFVNYQTHHAFPEAERKTIELFAALAAIAIQNARLLEQERDLRHQTATLREASSAISSADELEEVTDRILDGLGQIVDYRTASLQLIRGDTRTLVASRGFDRETVNWWFLRPISQDPLIRRVVAGKDPLILSKPSKDPDWGTHADTSDVKSWIGLPLIHHQEVVGLLTLDHDQPGFYKPTLKDPLAAFAKQIAVDIRNARFFDSTQRRIRDLEVINEVAQAIGTKLEIEDLLHTIVSQITTQLDCTHCTLFFPKEEDGELFLVPRVTYGGRSEIIMTRRFRPREGLAGWVFRHGRSLVLENAMEDPRFAPARDKQDQPRSMLVVPIKVGDQTIGVISADQDAFGWFSESDRRLVDALARQAGIAIERAAGLELLRDIGNRIISAQQVDEILEQIVFGAIELTHTTSGVIYLIGKDGKSVTKSFGYPPEFEHPEPRIGEEKGLTHHVVSTSEPLVLPDIRRNGRVSPFLRGRVRSMIATPLKYEGKTIGVLYLNDEKPHDSTETEQSLLSTLASQAAIAIKNAQLYEQRSRDVAALQEVNKAITTASLEEIAELIVQEAVVLTQARHGGLWVMDEDQGRLVLGAMYGQEPRQDWLLVDEHSINGWVALTGEAYNCPDASKDPHYLLSHEDVRSSITVPMRFGGRATGTLYTESEKLNAFSDYQLGLLQSLADQAAVAIQNAQLFQELEKGATQLVRLQEVTAISSAEQPDLDGLLHLIVHNLTDVFRETSCAIRLYDSDKDVFGDWIAAGALEKWEVSPRPGGTSRYVLQSKTPLYVEDTATTLPDGQLAIREEFVDQGVMAIAHLPLLSRGEAIGALYVDFTSAHRFSQNEKLILELFADQTAIAIENARLYDRRRRDITSLQDINGAVASGERDKVLQLIVDKAIEVMPGEYSSLWLKEPETGDFVLAAAGGMDSAWTQESGRLEARVDSFIMQVADTGEPHICEDMECIEEGSSALPRFYEASRSAVTVPLKYQDKVVGVLHIESSLLAAFTNQHAELLAGFADQAAIAIENARLYGQAQSRAEALTQLNEVGQSLVSVQDFPQILEATLKRIAQSAQKVLDADLVDLYQYVQDQDRFLTPPVMIGERWHHTIPEAIREDDVVVKIVREGKPQYFEEAQGAPLLSSEFEVPREAAPEERFVIREGIQSSAAIPLKIGDNTVGVMFVSYRKPLSFTDEQRERTELFAVQAAIAINNARLVQQLRERADEVRLLQQASAQVSSSLELEAILPLLIEGAMHLTKTKSGVVHVLDSAGQRVVHSYGYPEEFSHPSPRISEEGYTRFIIQAREQWVVEDTDLDERANPDIREKGVRSFVGTPLILAGKRVVGVLYVNDTDVRRFTEEELSLLSALADQAAIAVENARLFEETTQRAKEIALANEVGKLLSATRGIKDIPRLLVKETLEAFGAEAGSLALIDTETREIEFQFALDHKGIETFDESMKGYKMPLDKGIAGAVVQSGEPVISNNVQEDSRWHKEVDSVTGFTTKSILAVPLIRGNQVLGIIEIVNKQDGSAFSEREKDVLSTLALSAAIAIENTRLLDGLERRAARLALLQEITATISAQPPNIDKVLRLVVNKLGDIFQEASCAIRLYDSRTGQFTPHTGTGLFEDSVSRSPRPEGTSRYIVNTRQPRYLERDELLSPPDGGPGVREDIAKDVEAAAYLPLISDGDIIGILYMNLTESYQFSKDDRRILELFADQAAIAIENARLHEQRATDIAALQEINEAITSASRKEIIRLVVQKARDLTQAEYVGLWTKEGNRLVPGAMYGGEFLEIPELPIDEQSINGYVAKTGEPYVCTDVESDPYYRRWREEIQSSAAFPLKFAGRVIGTLGAESAEQGAFKEYQLKLLQSLADQAAIAIENARLYQEVEQSNQSLDRRIRELEILTEIGRTVSNLGIDQILDLVYEQAGKIVDLRNAQVQIAFYDETKDEVSFPLAVEQDNGETIDLVRRSRREDKYKQLHFRAGLDLRRNLEENNLKAIRQQLEKHGVDLESTDAVRQTEILKGEQGPILWQVVDTYGNALYDIVKESGEETLGIWDGDVVRQFRPRVKGDRRGLNEKVIDSQQPLLITGDPDKDFQQKATDLGITVWPTFGREDRPTHSWLGVPMMVSGRVIGVMSVQSLEMEQAFDESTQNLLDTVANQAAVAIENGRLYGDLRTAYEELRRAREREILAALGEVTAGLVHKMSNTVGPIPSLVERVRKAVTPTDEATNTKLHRISEGAANALSYTAGLAKILVLGRITREPADARALVDDALGEAVPNPARQGISLEPSYGPDLPTLYVNSPLVIESIRNILQNAVEAMPSGGTLAVTVERIGGEGVQIRIADTGGGIPGAMRPQLFQAGFSSKKEGKGIGLWFSKTVVEQHQGTISFESQEGTGTTFTVFLPVGQPSTNEEVAGEEVPSV